MLRTLHLSFAMTASLLTVTINAQEYRIRISRMNQEDHIFGSYVCSDSAEKC